MANFDAAIMQQLIDLAETRVGATGVNPSVAAGLVVDGQLVQTAFHVGEGQDHAEVALIKACGDLCKGATLYVTLEPCTHTGRTGPCADAVCEASFSKVVYAVHDVNPEVRERSSDAVMQAAGIEVVPNVMPEAGRALNRVFFHVHEKQRPFYTVKVAQTQNRAMTRVGREPGFLTSEESRRHVHAHRRQADAILVGIGTVLADDPALTVRYGLCEPGFSQPDVIVWDPKGDCPKTAQLFKEPGRRVFVLRDLDWDCFHAWCLERGLRHVYVEGGAKTYQRFIEAELLDRVMIYEAPFEVEGSDVFSPFSVSDYTFSERLGPDSLYLGECHTI